MLALSVFFLLGLLLQVNAQASPAPTSSFTASISNSGTNSGTVSASSTFTATSSISATASSSVSTTGSITRSSSNSNTGSNSATSSKTSSKSMTYPPPVAPTNLVNTCPGHSIMFCLSWKDTTGTLVFFSVYYRITGSGAPLVQIDVPVNHYRLMNLKRGTSYDIQITGYDKNGVEGFATPVTTFTTAVGTPKQVSSQDINNIQCAPLQNPTTNRWNIKCTWNAARPLAPTIIVGILGKCRCVSTIRDNVFIRKYINPTNAPTATSMLFRINRDVATCNIYLKALYANSPTHFRGARTHPGTRWHQVVVVGV